MLHEQSSKENIVKKTFFWILHFTLLRDAVEICFHSSSHVEGYLLDERCSVKFSGQNRSRPDRRDPPDSSRPAETSLDLAISKPRSAPASVKRSCWSESAKSPDAHNKGPVGGDAETQAATLLILNVGRRWRPWESCSSSHADEATLSAAEAWKTPQTYYDMFKSQLPVITHCALRNVRLSGKGHIYFFSDWKTVESDKKSERKTNPSQMSKCSFMSQNSV